MEDFFSKSIVKANASPPPGLGPWHRPGGGAHGGDATREGGTSQEGHTPPPSRSAPLLACEGEAGCACLLPFVWKQGCRARGRGCVPLLAGAPLPGRVSPACPPSWSVPGAQPQRLAHVCLPCTAPLVARPLSSQMCAPLLVTCLSSSWSCAALPVANPPLPLPGHVPPLPVASPLVCEASCLRGGVLHSVAAPWWWDCFPCTSFTRRWRQGGGGRRWKGPHLCINRGLGAEGGGVRALAA